MYNDYMYAVDRSDEYLAHYGIKGMKWGVQKAIESGNSRKLARQYKKAQKKLARLEKRANSSNKYAKRAAVLGAGALTAAGLGGVGMQKLSQGAASAGSKVRNFISNRKAINAVKSGTAASLAANVVKPGQTARGITDAAAGNLGRQVAGYKPNGITKPGQLRGVITDTATGNLGRQANPGFRPNNFAKPGQAAKGLADTATGNLGRQMNPGFKPNNFAKPGQGARGLTDTATKNIGAQVNTAGAGAGSAARGLNGNQLFRIGAGVAGAGLLGAAAYNAYRARTSGKAAAKAQQFRSEMNKAFAGTQYANGGKGSSGGSKKRRRR